MTDMQVPMTWEMGSRLARRHERRLFRTGQPLVWLFAQYARLTGREVVRVPFFGYVINGAVAVREMLLDAERFPNSNSKPESVLITQALGENTLVNMNGTAHRELRLKLVDLFTPKYTREVADVVLSGIMEDFHDRLAAGETVDVARFARILTGAVVCHLNGYDLHGQELEDRALELTDIGRRAAAMVPARMRAFDAETLAKGHALVDELLAGAKEAFEHGEPSTIPGRLRETGISWEQARGIIAILVLGGTETTQAGSTRLVALLADTKQWGRLRADPSLLENTLDEGMRVVTPVPAVTRWVAEDSSFRGVKMRKDRLVVAFLNNAMRDRRVIERGSDFDITRTVPRELRLLWFGAGPHFCLGINLARREIGMVLEQLMRLPREIEVVDREYADEVLMPSYKRLLVRMRDA